MKRFTILIILLLLLGGTFFLYYSEGSLPVNKNDKEYQNFVIGKGENVTDIINNLYKENLIRNKIVFLLIIKQLNIENKIQAGLFNLSQSMSAMEVAQSLTKGSNDIWVTFIEGLRKEEVAQILSSQFDIPESEFIRRTNEGYLFPDTYLISRQASMDDIISMFTNNFHKKYTPELQALAQKRGLSDNEVITIASLVEREANSKAAKNEVASIIYKRYKNGWPLEIDATVQYILGYQENEKDWWKKSLTKADLQIDSPYNTYQHPGLPPGPIASPGLDAIEAAVNANENTPYWFYISNADGSQMLFAKTLEEHNANIRKHLQ